MLYNESRIHSEAMPCEVDQAMLEKIKGNKLLLLLMVLVIVISTLVIYWRRYYQELRPSPTEQFIIQHMVNANGTLATYLQDGISDTPEIPAGREALSESLGLWMQYAVLKGDQALFNQSFEVLNRWFITPQGYISWKLSEDGDSRVNTNALIDDFRIIEALSDAADRWNEERYREVANQLSNTVTSFLLQDGIFVDYYDFTLRESSSFLSLSYLDMSAMDDMLHDQSLDPSIYQWHKTLLLNMPNDGRFYPRGYDLASATYSYDDTVNLIDQLLVALNGMDIGSRPDPLYAFIKTEFTQRQQLLGRYNRLSGQPDANYESPAVYGLSILLALKLGDAEFATQLYDRMLELRGEDPAYPGGYVFHSDTHLFDNVIPLIAEQTLLQQTRGMKY